MLQDRGHARPARHSRTILGQRAVRCVRSGPTATRISRQVKSGSRGTTPSEQTSSLHRLRVLPVCVSGTPLILQAPRRIKGLSQYTRRMMAHQLLSFTTLGLSPANSGRFRTGRWDSFIPTMRTWSGSLLRPAPLRLCFTSTTGILTLLGISSSLTAASILPAHHIHYLPVSTDRDPLCRMDCMYLTRESCAYDSHPTGGTPVKGSRRFLSRNWLIVRTRTIPFLVIDTVLFGGHQRQSDDASGPSRGTRQRSWI
mmetsp:Transcript_48659/g.115528  ORF Transcript_48659/g.115528 Transcript_48659/m.115528 type:complete len:255 (+) Transcript_48659:946-1710(+)